MRSEKLIEERLTHSIIGAFFEVHNTLGFGFLELLYVRAMEQELRALGHNVERERRVPVWYKGTKLSEQRLDMLVDGRASAALRPYAQVPPHRLSEGRRKR